MFANRCGLGAILAGLSLLPTCMKILLRGYLLGSTDFNLLALL